MTPTENPTPQRKTYKPMDEGYYRMIAAGWKIHNGTITESDIKTHEFKMMGDNTFKILKEVKS